MKLVITIDVDEKPNPGNRSHLAALIANPSSKYIIEYKKEI